MIQYMNRMREWFPGQKGNQTLLYGINDQFYTKKKKVDFMKEFRFIYVILFGIALLTFIFQNTSITLAILLTLTLLPVCLYVWLRLACKSLKLQIEQLNETKPGQTMKIRISVSGKQLSALGRISGKASVIHIVLQKEMEERVELFLHGNVFEDVFEYKIEHCGKIQVQIENLKMCDCMGLTSCRMRTYEEKIYLILPEDAQNMESTGYVKPLGNEFVGVRDYHEGDAMSGVHWKLSGKWDKLLVKEYGDLDWNPEGSSEENGCQTCTFYDLCYNHFVR